MVEKKAKKLPRKRAVKKGFELPAGYGDSKIVLMVRDPHWVYAYWELPSSKYDEFKNQYGQVLEHAKLALRVYDVTDINFNGRNAWSFSDIEVTGAARNWYINVASPNRSYIVDLGFLTRDGKFITAARSNAVTTPRSGPSDVIDEEWMTVEFERMYKLSGGYDIGKSSLRGISS